MIKSKKSPSNCFLKCINVECPVSKVFIGLNAIWRELYQNHNLNCYKFACPLCNSQLELEQEADCYFFIVVGFYHEPEPSEPVYLRGFIHRTSALEFIEKIQINPSWYGIDKNIKEFAIRNIKTFDV